MNATARVEMGPDDTERNLLWHGLLEWTGPAQCSEEMAIAIGFRGVADLLEEGQRIADDLRVGRGLTKADWYRALMATEVVFASDVVGSGIDWSITTGMDDYITLRALRSVQRKFLGTGDP